MANNTRMKDLATNVKRFETLETTMELLLNKPPYGQAHSPSPISRYEILNSIFLASMVRMFYNG